MRPDLKKETDIYSIKNQLFHDRVNPDQISDYPLKPEALRNINVEFHLDTKGVYD